MNAHEAIKNALATPDFVVKAYLADLCDADLLVRPVPGVNHIAWQLGHLICSEREMVEAIAPGSMPALPANFAAQHSKETAGSDKPGDFLKKEDYVKLMDEVRAGTVKALGSFSDTDLDKPAPESMRSYAPTIASVFTLQPSHWMMHAGQWAVTRRKLGRAPLF